MMASSEDEHRAWVGWVESRLRKVGGLMTQNKKRNEVKKTAVYLFLSVSSSIPRPKFSLVVPVVCPHSLITLCHYCQFWAPCVIGEGVGEVGVGTEGLEVFDTVDAKERTMVTAFWRCEEPSTGR